MNKSYLCLVLQFIFLMDSPSMSLSLNPSHLIPSALVLKIRRINDKFSQ